MTIKTAGKTQTPAPSAPKPTTEAKKATPTAKPSAPKAAAKPAKVAAPATATKTEKAPFTGISLGEFKRMAKALVDPKAVKAGNKQLQSKQARTRLTYSLVQAGVWMATLRASLKDVIIGFPIKDSHRKDAEIDLAYMLQNLIHAATQVKVKVPGLGRKFKAVGTILDNLLALDAAMSKLGHYVASAADGTAIFPGVTEAGEAVPSPAYEALKADLAQAIEGTYVITRMLTNKSAQDVVTAHGQYLKKEKGPKFFEPAEKAPLTPEQQVKKAANAEKLKATLAKAVAAKAAAKVAAKVAAAAAIPPPAAKPSAPQKTA